MKILGALVCGIVVGVVGVGSAHHQPAQRKLAGRVAALERQIEGQQESIDTLAGRTQLLDTGDGEYLGEIQNYQIAVPLEVCHHLDDAVWGDDPNDNRDVAYLGCVRGAYRRL